MSAPLPNPVTAFDVEQVRALAGETRSGVTFLCGSVENEADVREYGISG